MGSMTDFFIRDKANDGKRVDLYDLKGKETGEYIVIRSVHSDAYQAAKTDYIQRSAKHAAGDADKPEVEEVIAAIIKEWSFDEELNAENALAFLKNAPHITEQLDKLVTDVEFFYAKK